MNWLLSSSSNDASLMNLTGRRLHWFAPLQIFYTSSILPPQSTSLFIQYLLLLSSNHTFRVTITPSWNPQISSLALFSRWSFKTIIIQDIIRISLAQSLTVSRVPDQCFISLITLLATIPKTFKLSRLSPPNSEATNEFRKNQLHFLLNISTSARITFSTTPPQMQSTTHNKTSH